jgi:glycosyltransferase involved in cell wall biosynthesis
MRKNEATIGLAIPSYSRPRELRYLLQTIKDLRPLPDEILIVDDHSPNYYEIEKVVEEFNSFFPKNGLKIRLYRNEKNLGYDGNIRRLIELVSSDYLVLCGNDDAFLNDAIRNIKSYTLKNPEVKFISRTFVKFRSNLDTKLGITRLADSDHTFTLKNSKPRFAFKLCGFVSGLVIFSKWAKDLNTEVYDGTLYYQFYLASIAFHESGIGYISNCIVGSRVGNKPLFGNSVIEKDVHIPGSYSPKGRAHMWGGILRISNDISIKYSNFKYKDDIKVELQGRQSIHIFEMMASRSRLENLMLFNELRKLNLIYSFLPWFLLINKIFLGRYAWQFYRIMRFLQFRMQNI